MLRILEFGMSSVDFQGGIEAYLINQYRHFDKEKFQCDFIKQGNKKMAHQEEILEGGSFIYTICERRKKPFKSLLDSIRLMYCIAGKYDVFVMNFGGIPNCGMMLFLAYLARIPRRIVHAHGSALEVKRNFLKRCIDKLDYFFVERFATDYWACSVSAGKFMFKNADIKVIKNGIDADKFKFNALTRKLERNRLNIIDDCMVIGSIGRITPIKNYLFLIDVFNELHRIYTNSKLVIVGNFASEENLKYVKDLMMHIEYYGLSDDIVLHPYTENIANLYQAFDVFVMTSIKEGLSLVSIEAQAAGLPCLLSTGIPKEAIIISNNVKQLSVTESPKFWAEGILELYYKVQRYDTSNLVKKAGFDAAVETKRVECIVMKKDKCTM